MGDQPRVIQTGDQRRLVDEARDIIVMLDGAAVDEELEYEGRTVTPAMLLSVAINRLQRAAIHLDSTRLTYFGFPEP